MGTAAGSTGLPSTSVQPTRVSSSPWPVGTSSGRTVPPWRRRISSSSPSWRMNRTVTGFSTGSGELSGSGELPGSGEPSGAGETPGPGEPSGDGVAVPSGASVSPGLSVSSGAGVLSLGAGLASVSGLSVLSESSGVSGSGESAGVLAVSPAESGWAALETGRPRQTVNRQHSSRDRPRRASCPSGEAGFFMVSRLLFGYDIDSFSQEHPLCHTMPRYYLKAG